MGVFPGAIPAGGTAVPTATLAAAGHTALHNLHSDEIRAIATKLGIGASTPVAGTFLKSNVNGESEWAALDIQTDTTGNLPVSRGGTGVDTVAELKALINEHSYPVGSIYVNANDSTNPSALLGVGTWVSFGEGRVMVGLNSGDTDFDTAEETGGAKTSDHTHDLSDAGWAQITVAAATPSVLYRRLSSVTSYTASHQSSASGAGSSAAQTTATPLDGATDSAGPSIVQPYVVVYMWKRTA